MSLPHLLLVDDSEAILAYEKAALSGHYAISTANNGIDGIKKARELKPDGVLLDLSMPEMNGEEVLQQMKADDELKHIPIIIVSSEKERAAACVKMGAASYLPKPIRADELRATVSRVLEDTSRKERQGSLAMLFVKVGNLEMGLPLDCVKSVLQVPLTQPLPLGPSYLCEMFNFHGQPVCILDMARRLGVEHTESVVDRKLIVVSHENTLIGLCVDLIRDPEEYPPEEIMWHKQVGGADHGPLSEALMAIVKTARGPLPIIETKSLLSKKLLREIPAAVKNANSQGVPAAAVAAAAVTPKPGEGRVNR